jgi:uncharacterized protein YjbI with pentapeptide repeats
LHSSGLSGADLSKAKMWSVQIFRANLSWADLSGAEGIWNELVEEHAEYRASYLERATMPNGQKYEDWLKSKGRREDGENSGPS